MNRDKADNRLLTPFTLNAALRANNRIVLAPMTRARAGQLRIPNELMAEYYRQRASAGLMISEATVVSTQGIGWVDSPGIYSDAQTEGWKLVVESVHRAGGVMLLQLWHCGRASHSTFHLEEGAPVAPSPIAIQGDGIQTPNGREPYETPRALATEEVLRVVDDYRQAAKRALQAGFDGVEIHGANGYLIDQFLQSKTNHRTDRYGGNVENRCRFLDDIVQAVTAEVPATRVGVRLSPNGVFNDMGSPDFRETFTFAAQQLARYGLAYLHLVDGLAFGFHKLGDPMTLSEFRRVFYGPLIGNGGYTPATAEAAIRDGSADLIAFGRPYISNPDLVERIAQGWPLAPDALMDVWYVPDPRGYTDFPVYR
ncbi:MAG: alkene reductase [Nitrospirota bacterium]